ncbi:MAG: aminoacyl-tRNA hydrolase [Bacteroidetes bacterium]|nr:aminoacyl-tRNA hydrolase [Bacteroidota bacterium]
MKYLIAGLGNIGTEYNDTRHNVGFEIADELVRAAGTSYKLEKYALTASFKLKGKQILLIKPTTYMNLSGKAVRYWMQKEKIKKENVLVLVDDLALPFGTIRLKGKGSAGGHNGLKDIQQELQTTSYARVRFGIGDEFHKGQQVRYVLGKWDDRELDVLPERILKAAEAARSFCTIGLAHSMNRFNNQ